MASYGLYTHIQSNKRRSVALLIGLFLLVYVLVYAGAIAGEALSYDASPEWYLRKAWQDLLEAAPYATVGTAIWIVIAYYFHQSMIDAVTGAHDVTRAEQPRLYNLLENLCISRGIPMPKLKVMQSNALNAFATGMNEKQYAVTVTTGLLAALDDAEIEAVLGHELTHIRNGDVRMLVIAVVIAGVVSFAAELIFQICSAAASGSAAATAIPTVAGAASGGDPHRSRVGRGRVGVVVVYPTRFVALARVPGGRGLGRADQEPRRHDLGPAQIEGRGELPSATSAVMEMCVDNPREEFADLFSTHPSVERRVEALVRYAGGHDPGPLQLPAPGQPTATDAPPAEAGPWSQPDPAGKPFLPDRAPIEPNGPWGPHNGQSP